jgi:hypothetical protein
MKTVISRITNGFLVLLCLSAVTTASAVQITFQVNMGVQTSFGLFDPSSQTVHVAGSFSSWTNALTLQPQPGDTNIYEGTLDIPGEVGATMQFKFLINQSGTEVWEGNVGPNNTANRTFTLPADPQVLPLVYFNNEGSGETIDVVFQVNLGVQESIDEFDPATDVVQVRGFFGFSNWDAGYPLVQSAADTNIYEATVPLTAPQGTVIDYKFVMVRTNAAVVWEGNVGPGGSSGNRRYRLTEASQQILPTVYFNNLTNDPGAGIEVTFQVNMEVQTALNRFLPEIDTVTVAGSFNGWNTTVSPLQQDTENTNLYTGTFGITTISPGATIDYKFVINGGTWEDGANRNFVLADTAQTLPAVYFNRLNPGEVLLEDTLVTFHVDMNGAVPFGGGTPFDPQLNAVYINGNFVPGGWWAWGAPLGEYWMIDDGASYGDAVASDGIYTWQGWLLAGSPVPVQYKYSIDGADNEAAVGNDRVRYIRAAGEYVMPLDTFGVMVQETVGGDLGTLTISPVEDGQVTISWNGAAGVRLQVATSVTGNWEDVSGTDGQSSAILAVESGEQFFRLIGQ